MQVLVLKYPRLLPEFPLHLARFLLRDPQLCSRRRTGASDALTHVPHKGTPVLGAPAEECGLYPYRLLKAFLKIVIRIMEQRAICFDTVLELPIPYDDPDRACPFRVKGLGRCNLRK